MEALMRRFALLSMALAVGFVLAPAGAAQAHSWYDGSCCDEGDCRQTTLGEVERHDDGWYVVPTKELIPFDDDRIRRSLDPLIHRCIMPGGKSRCLYVPEMGE